MARRAQAVATCQCGSAALGVCKVRREPQHARRAVLPRRERENIATTGQYTLREPASRQTSKRFHAERSALRYSESAKLFAHSGRKKPSV